MGDIQTIINPQENVDLLNINVTDSTENNNLNSNKNIKIEKTKTFDLLGDLGSFSSQSTNTKTDTEGTDKKSNIIFDPFDFVSNFKQVN